MLDKQPWYAPRRPHCKTPIGWASIPHPSSDFSDKLLNLLMTELVHVFQCWRYLKGYCRWWCESARDVRSLPDVWHLLASVPLSRWYQQDRDNALADEILEVRIASIKEIHAGRQRSLLEIPATLGSLGALEDLN